jgi:ribosomal protein S6-L-glutamate ligase RimK-like protein
VRERKGCSYRSFVFRFGFGPRLLGLRSASFRSADCIARCRAVTAAMGFVIAGVDLRCENGTCYCFEVNPSPGFMYYQEQTGQPIDEAIARLLATACQNS